MTWDAVCERTVCERTMCERSVCERTVCEQTVTPGRRNSGPASASAIACHQPLLSPTHPSPSIALSLTRYRHTPAIYVNVMSEDWPAASSAKKEDSVLSLVTWLVLWFWSVRKSALVPVTNDKLSSRVCKICP